ncbi:MAG: competence protein ComEC [Arcobacter sp.]|nr:MAG: competence protein ComEC [Arcobacter sp.]
MKASPSLLSKTQLFTSTRQKLFALGVLLLLFTLSLFMQYLQFQKLTEFDDHISTVYVEKQYKKKNYWVLKLQSSEGFSFYTSSRDNLKNIEGRHLRVRLFIKDLTFLSYLKGFYLPSQILMGLELKEKRYEMMEDLEELHEPQVSSLYKALFFAGSIPSDIRQQLSALGINHLLAISGFHLGVLSFILFFSIKLIYIPFQKNFFPYRNSHRDIAVFVFALLFLYLYFLDFVPSLLRSFAMSIFAYILYDRGIKILSFTSLFLVVGFLIALWPRLLFALGFWFSVSGVFYIFLFLHHMKDLKPWQTFLWIHVWVYLAMLPIVHYFFGTFSLGQLFSPILSMLFIVFYPLSLLIHVLGFPTLLDPLLVYMLSLKFFVIEVFIPLYFFVFIIFISLLAIIHKFFFYLLFFFNLCFLGYFLYGIT